MLADKESQAIVIMGGSGSGKSVVAKETLRFLVHVGSGSSGVPIEDAFDVLEAFGNAGVGQSLNSSRHCKVVSVKYRSCGALHSVAICPLLLEQSRLTRRQRQADDGNFRILYSLLDMVHENHAQAQTGRRWGLKIQDARIQNYQYLAPAAVLGGSDHRQLSGLNQQQQHPLRSVLPAMAACGVGAQDQDCVFQTLAAVLHAGNIEFRSDAGSTNERGGEVAVVGGADGADSSQPLSQAAALLGVDQLKLKAALTSRNIGKHSTYLV
jgi:myosin heavy subunit